MNRIRLTASDISVGKGVPWQIYDRLGRLLLRRGEAVDSAERLSILLDSGLFRDELPADRKPTETAKKTAAARKSPFEQIVDFIFRFSQLTIARSVDTKSIENFSERTLGLARDMRELVDRDSDAVLTAMNLGFEQRDGADKHGRQVYVALLADVVARRLQTPSAHRDQIIAASLSANLGMFHVSELLQNQRAPLTDQQKKIVFEHPGRSAAILEKLGVDAPLWLRIVKEHHERVDGLGYPQRLGDEKIALASKIVALAESYTAMVLPRLYRPSVNPKDALAELFFLRGKQVDIELANLLIKELGVYPPGCLVKLANGDLAVVVKRGAQSTAPLAISIVSAGAGAYQLRDCAESDYAIVSAEKYPDKFQLDPNALWKILAERATSRTELAE